MIMNAENSKIENGGNSKVDDGTNRKSGRNPNGSTGPRTVEGKERSKYNALKHGLSAKSVLLPGDDPEEYRARVECAKESLETRNEFEEGLAERAVQADWMRDRALGAETARVTEEMLTGPRAKKLQQFLEAEAIWQRLMFDRRGPTEMYPSGKYEHKGPRTSTSGEPVDEDRPARLVPQLEATLPGCQLLLETWGDLGGLLRSGLGWQSPDKFKAIRLIGRQPVDAFSSEDVALIFLASHVIEPQSSYAFHELRCEIPEDEFKRQKGRLERWEQLGITPKDAEAARGVLLEIVDRVVERLRGLEAEYQREADRLEPLQPRKLSEVKPSFVRLLDGCGRLQKRSIDTIYKIRREQDQGWDCVRNERQRRKNEKRREEERRRALEADPRIVVDEHGTLRHAIDYDGDVAEGEARFKAKFGEKAAAAIVAAQPMDAGSDYGRGMPDFARWEAARQQAEDGGIRTEGGGHEAEDAGAGRCVPVILVGTGEGANVQNEVPAVGERVALQAPLGAPQSHMWGVTTRSVVTSEVVPIAEDEAVESALCSPQSGMGSVVTSVESAASAPQSGMGDVTMRSVITSSGGLLEARRGNPETFAEPREAVNVQNEVPPVGEGRCETGNSPVSRGEFSTEFRADAGCGSSLHFWDEKATGEHSAAAEGGGGIS